MKRPVASLSGTIALIVIVLLAAACSRQPNVESTLLKVRDYMEAENYPAAEIELKNVLKADNRNPEAISSMGILYFNQGRFREAFPFLNAAQSLDPENTSVLVKHASLLLIAGRPDVARQEAAKILARDPKNENAPLIVADSIQSLADLSQGDAILRELEESPAVLTARAFLDIKRQALTSAETRLNKALELNPEFGPAYSGKFTIAMSQGQLEAATEALEKAAEYTPKRTGIRAAYADHIAKRLGKPDEALAYLEALNDEIPDFIPIATRLAELYAQANRIEDAKKLNLEVLKLDPMEPTALRLKGVIAASSKDYDAAISILTSMLELYPQDVKANYQLALAYIANNQKTKAKAPLEFVGANAPGSIETAILLASLQSEEGDFSGAIITLRNLVANRPESSEAKLLLAEAYNRQGNYDAALALYEEIDSQAESTPDISYLSGITQLRSRNRDEARRAFESALKSNPLHLQSVEQLTALDLSERSYESALQRISDSLQLAPDTSILHVIKAQILNAMGRRDEAEDSFKQAIELDSENRIAHTLLSRFYLSLNRTDEALEHLNIILENNPEDITTLTSLASLYEAERNYKEARESYGKILNLAPQNLAALNNLAYLISIEDGPTDKALELAESARKVAPTSPFTADTLGWILYQRKEFVRAKALLLDSLSRLTDNAEVNYHVGAASYALGEIDDAQRTLRVATAGEDQYNGREDALHKLKILEIDTSNPSDETLSILEESSANNDPIATVKLGIINREKGDSQAAISQFRKTLGDYPTNLLAQLNLALALSETGSTEEAIELTKSAEIQRPNDIEVTYAQAKVAYQARDYTWAASLFSQVERQLPNNADVRLESARAKIAVGQLDDAIDSATKAVNLFNGGTKKEDAQNVSSGLLALKSSATPDVDQQLNPNDLVARLVRAKSMGGSENSSPAVVAYEEIIKDYPEQAQAKLELASLLLDSEQTAAKAYRLARESRSAIGNTPRVIAVQAIAQYILKQYDRSVQQFVLIPEGQRTSPIWTYYYGMSLVETGKLEQAKALLTEAIENGLPSKFSESANTALQRINSEM
ncbi:Tetratricopeptide repeat family [Verrucomicrobiia bacterium DG1235]|nr:Tetratricopeptide repeat family [Verrucomicrobiae bacterium DG1235]